MCQHLLKRPRSDFYKPRPMEVKDYWEEDRPEPGERPWVRIDSSQLVMAMVDKHHGGGVKF